MRMILGEMDLWDIVDGSEQRPEVTGSEDNAKAVKAYDRRAKKALASICLNLTDSQLLHVRSSTTAKEAWNKLTELYEAKGLANRLFLRRKFFTIQMADGENMVGHINKVKTMAEQLEAIGAPVKEDDIVMTLLSSLPQSYSNLIIALETRSDNLTLEFVTARLLHEESRRKETSSQKEEAAFYSQPTPKHALINKKRTDTCNYCKKPGHWFRNCRKRAADEKKKGERANKASSDHDQLFVVAFTTTTDDKESWYIDSGASQHLTYRREWFETYETIAPRKVYMGDDHPHEAIGKGTIRVNLYVNGGKIRGVFTDVLHVPNIANNLLSVSKMTSTGLRVEFGDNTCTIKGEKEKVVGVALREKKSLSSYLRNRM